MSTLSTNLTEVSQEVALRHIIGAGCADRVHCFEYTSNLTLILTLNRGVGYCGLTSVYRKADSWEVEQCFFQLEDDLARLSDSLGWPWDEVEEDRLAAALVGYLA